MFDFLHLSLNCAGQRYGMWRKVQQLPCNESTGYPNIFPVLVNKQGNSSCYLTIITTFQCKNIMMTSVLLIALLYKC